MQKSGYDGAQFRSATATRAAASGMGEEAAHRPAPNPTARRCGLILQSSKLALKISARVRAGEPLRQEDLVELASSGRAALRRMRLRAALGASFWREQNCQCNVQFSIA
jgi:hypothetical protein